MGKAQKDVSRKKTTTTRGWGRGESEGTPVRLFDKKLLPIYQILVYPPYDWSILTVLVSTKVHYVDWKCDALAIRLHIRLS